MGKFQKVVEKVGMIVDGSGGLKKAVEAGDETAVRRILADLGVNVKLAAAMLAVPAEVERLRKIIKENSDLEDTDAIDTEIGALSRYQPKSLEEALKAKEAILSARKRRDKSWFGPLARIAAQAELAGLYNAFAEIITGERSRPLRGEAHLPAVVHNLLVENDLSANLLGSFSWREAFALQAAAPKKRLKVVQR